MIVVVVAVVLVLAVGVVVVGAATGLVGGGRRGTGDGTGLGAALAVPAAVGAGVIVVLLAVAVLGVGGARSRRGGELTEPPASVPSDEADIDDEPVALAGAPAAFDGRVTIDQQASPLRPRPLVAGLATGKVVEVSGVGFLGSAEGVVAQCHRADDAVCRNIVTILTDDEGRLRVPYRVEGPTSGDVLVVEVDFARGAARLGFGADAVAPVLSLQGETTVVIRDAVPGDRLDVRRCDPDVATIAACETLGRAAVGTDGTATFELDARPEAPSMLTVVGDDGLALAEPVRVQAAPRAGADVDLAPTQLLVGFGVALLLLGVAISLIRTTDWRVPAEAATPFLDAAPLGD